MPFSRRSKRRCRTRRTSKSAASVRSRSAIARPAWRAIRARARRSKSPRGRFPSSSHRRNCARWSLVSKRAISRMRRKRWRSDHRKWDQARRLRRAFHFRCFPIVSRASRIEFSNDCDCASLCLVRGRRWSQRDRARRDERSNGEGRNRAGTTNGRRSTPSPGTDGCRERAIRVARPRAAAWRRGRAYSTCRGRVTVHSAIVDRPIDPSKLLERVAARGNGAAVLFLGTVRDVNAGRGVSGIEYTAYRSMAERELHRIVEEAALLADSNDIAVEHRLGELAIGECSVAVAAAHPHRARAFEAARYVIEELKQRVPIWKREQYDDGTREWVPATTPENERTIELVDAGEKQ